MRMSIAQPSQYLVILTPLDREAKAWYLTQILDGYPAPHYLHPAIAQVVVEGFEQEGGVLVPH